MMLIQIAYYALRAFISSLCTMLMVKVYRDVIICSNNKMICLCVMLNQANVVFTNGILIGNAIFCAFKSLHLFNIGI